MKVKFVISYHDSLRGHSIMEGETGIVNYADERVVSIDCGFDLSTVMSHKAFHTCCREVDESQEMSESWILREEMTYPKKKAALCVN